MIGPKHKGAPPTAPFEEIMVKAQQALDANDLDMAQRLFGQATVVKPASPTAWYGKGRAFSLQEAWDKALRCFAIATKFDPKFANALGNFWIIQEATPGRFQMGRNETTIYYRDLESAKKVLKYILDHELEVPTKTPKGKLPQFVDDLAVEVSEEIPYSTIDTSYYKLI